MIQRVPLTGVPPEPVPDLSELLGHVARGDEDAFATVYDYEPERGSAMSGVMTLAHRRAVDRVRSAQAAGDRDNRAALLDRTPAFDEVTEQVEAMRDGLIRMRDCLGVSV